MPPRPSRHLCSLSLRANDTSAIKNPQWFQSHSFSTSTPKALPAPAKKKTSTSGPPKKGVTILRIKKKGVQQSTAKPPAPGERKALRKRIVLSNTNALEVPGLQEMGIGTLSNEASIGAVMALPGDVVDSLRAVEAFKPGQGWSFFRRPACLVRKENVELSKIIDSHDGRTTRKIICGEKGVGKSVFLLEAMATAFMKGWLVLNIPEGRELTVGHTAYAPIPNTTPLQYSQSTYTANLLSQFLKANKKLLSTLKLTSKPDFNFPLAQGTTLATLAEAGTNDEDRAWPVFQHIWRELQVPGRPPVLYCIDNISHIMGDSKYTTLDAADKLRPIHAHDFVQVKHFIDHLSGERELVNGGMVLAATSLSEHIKSAALDTVIKAAEARQENEGETRVSDHYDPYQKLDMRALKALTSDFESSGPPSGANAVPDAPATPEAIDTTATSEPTPEEATSVAASTVANELGVIRLKGITKAEAKTILEYWATSGMVRRQIEEKFVADQWTVAGGGVFKELERGCLRRTV
ncbi:hypothetical protein EG328_003712 [Venturia inaequalis]|uniref:Small ribosomal subunit protein mS29 n=1 Tax=Venturia inaequalis TaxID=5025 RepID=A0A8H3UQV2_VENIN|nr:hypothetical protein EG328_003712 [Venturia inaequalis]KAE9986960.1 hypothetical protein EG327_004070 [Venturia inaequalis]